MACGLPEIQRKQLEKYVEAIGRFNPAHTPGNLANIGREMESLIEQKLEMFPDDKRQIVSARVVMVGKDYRIEVASATL
jgi:hypothetical protein